MRFKDVKRFALGALAAVAVMTGISESAEACSRILYVGSDGALRIVGRSLDWKTPIPTNIYVYPRGIHKVGNTLPGSVEWTSKYGAVYAVGYDGGVTEGMNEKGLVINGLFCKGTVYDNDSTSNRPPMSLAVFVAWLLDMNATTPEVVDVLKKHDFNISGATFDGGTVSALHWGITDAEGRCAVLEFDNGNVKIYEGQDMPAMTNDPTFPEMNAINDYWQKVGGANMLPGTVKSPDRFVRGYYFDGHVAKTDNADLGVSIIRSILMNVSVPYLYTVESEPNVSSTQWRSFANLRDLRYYFDIVTNPGMFYVDLSKCDLSEGASVMKLDTSKSQDFVGDVTNRLVKSAPFKPMY
ncbi:MAG: linear amide C-N hydrolase [Muribaculaceae bacterium]|nr:linear amide C-N hydrolase [Muribaculaceae bacterium]